jgi:hypothetical protein
MKRIIVTLLALGTMLPTALGQGKMVPAQFIPIKGGDDGKTYSLVIKSPLDRKALVGTTLDYFVKAGYMEKEERAKINAAQAAEKGLSQEIDLPMGFYANTFFGSTQLQAPVIMTSKLEIEFPEDGIAMFTVNPVSELVFMPIDPEKKVIIAELPVKKPVGPKGGGLQIEIFGETVGTVGADKEVEIKPEWVEYENYRSQLRIDQPLTGGFTMNNFIQQHAEMLKWMDLCSKVAKTGWGKWMTDEEICEYTDNEASVKSYKEFMAEGRLIALNNARWQKGVRPFCNMAFIMLADTLQGALEEIIEDRQQKWQLLDGELAPSDPKAQAKYMKNLQKNKDKTVKTLFDKNIKIMLDKALEAEFKELDASGKSELEIDVKKRNLRNAAKKEILADPRAEELKQTITDFVNKFYWATVDVDNI